MSKKVTEEDESSIKSRLNKRQALEATKNCLNLISSLFQTTSYVKQLQFST